jgi:shikimate kinase
MEKSKVPASYLITGMKHTGKSSHGAAIAHHFGLPFFDLDLLIMELHLSGGGKASSVREIYRGVRREGFMALEARAAAALAERNEPAVVACGGGIADNAPALEAFRRAENPSFLFVHLSLPEDILFRRIAAGGLPPFLEGDGGEAGARERFHHLYLRREAVYRREARLVFELEERPREENSSLIISGIEEY